MTNLARHGCIGGMQGIIWMDKLSEVLSHRKRPALLIGNGINRFNGNATSGWEDLLGKLARNHDIQMTNKEAAEMSNTEFFDILDLARPKEDRRSLQGEFCDLMATWNQPVTIHRSSVGQRDIAPQSSPLTSMRTSLNRSIQVFSALVGDLPTTIRGARIFRIRKS